MAKGYWIGRVDVTDADAYQRYVSANAEAFAKYGARFLVRGGRCEAVEGTARSRNVVIEFADYATALACYRSPEYRRALALRTSASTIDLVIVEGYDGPQPAAGCPPPAPVHHVMTVGSARLVRVSISASSRASPMRSASASWVGRSCLAASGS
jgi:uncharacterized protein (DUF1330 family)